MAEPFKVALLQVDTIRGDLKANTKKMARLIERAAKRGAKLVVLPELSLSGGYLLRERVYDVAEEIPGPTSRTISRLCRRLGLYVVAGIAERSSSPSHTFYNSIFLAGPKGEILGVYRKVHLPWSAEKDYFRPGSTFEVYSTDLCRLGLLICWDICFPEAARILALKGAEVIIDPSAWIVEHRFMFDISTVARAHENNLFVIAVNRVGREDGINFFGGSRIVDPRGEVILQGGDREALLLGECDLELIKAMRLETRYFRERRPELYHALLEG